MICKRSPGDQSLDNDRYSSGRVCLFRFLGVILGVLLPALAAGEAWGVAPELEVLTGSSVTLIGSQRSIDPQAVRLIPMSPPPPAPFFRSGQTFEFPRISLALDDFVDIYQNQDFIGDLDTSTGESTITFPLWVIVWTCDMHSLGPFQSETGLA